MEMLDYDAIMFLLIAAVSTFSAIQVIRQEEIIHSLVYLASLFLSIGALYILLSSEFVALVQILVYVGAITVVILFGIMLTKREMHSAQVKRDMKEECKK